MSDAKENPFQIAYVQNPANGLWEVMIQIGALASEAECKQFGEIVSDWLTAEGGWKAKVQ